jgi:peptidylprolyl isomerase
MQIMKIKTTMFVLFLLILASCKNAGTQIIEEKTVKLGSVVTFDYAAGFDNGTLFDTSFEEAARQAGIYNPRRSYVPQRVEIGKDPLIAGLVQGLMGMKEGESKNLRIGPEKAYGATIGNSTQVLPRSAFENTNLEIGGMVVIATPEGDRLPVFISGLNEDNVTIDQNHPLAGEFIQFAVILRKIE